MKRRYRLGLVVLILIACAGCDQATKSIAKESLASSAPVSLLNDSVRLAYSENSGAFLGLGADLPGEIRLAFAIIFVGVALALTLAFAINPRGLGLMQLVGLSLVAAGSLGNLLDRLSNHGAVVDFIRLGIGPLRTGIFNLADVAILGGVSILLLFRATGKAKTGAA